MGAEYLAAAVSHVGHSIVQQRWELVHRKKEINQLIENRVDRYYKRIEQRYDRHDMKQEALTCLWVTCFTNDPAEDMQAFTQKFYNNLHMTLRDISRNQRAESRSLDKEVPEEAVDFDEITDDFDLEEHIAYHEAFQKLERLVYEINDPMLTAVHMVCFHTPREIEEQVDAYCLDRQWATIRNVPAKVAADCLGTNVKTYRRYRDYLGELLMRLVGGTLTHQRRGRAKGHLLPVPEWTSTRDNSGIRKRRDPRAGYG